MNSAATIYELAPLPAFGWLSLCFDPTMKAITYKVTDNGRGHVNTGIVPANHSGAARVDKAGLIIAGTLLLLTLAFVGTLLLVLLR